MSIIRKETAAAVGPDMTFVLSDATVDRMGDTIEPGGWDLRWFRKNPIALFGHDSGFPIGKWADVRVEGGKLLGRLTLAAEGTSARIDEIRRLVEQGVLRAVSVGFKPLEAEPKDKAQPWGAQTYKRQELLETSLVSVPANPAALALAKSLCISDDTMRMAFGEHVEDGPAEGRGTIGVKAASPNQTRRERGLPLLPRGNTMTKTLSQRVEDAQQAFVAARDAYNDHVAEADFDLDIADGLEASMKDAEKRLEALQRAEKALAGRAESDSPAPAVVRHPLGFQQREVAPLDLVVRSAVVNGISVFTGKSVDQVLDERYPGHEATEIVVKAAAPLGTTGTSGFASQLVQTTYASLVDALRGRSVYPSLRERGISQSFDAAGTAYIPSLTAGGANGSFFAEGSPIRVGRITVGSDTMTARKMGVILPFSRELAKRSTPSLEGILRNAILSDTAKVLDEALLDDVVGDTARPAGLLNGVSATATGYGGGDYMAVKEDFKNLLAPFIAANAADSITVIMNPAQGFNIAMMEAPVGNAGWFGEIARRVSIVESTHATAGRLIAVRTSDFMTATGDAPQFEMSNTATIHMEDSSPAEIVSTSGPTTANPVRSFFQTDSMGLRMVMDVSWKMIRSGMVAWIDGTSY